MRALPNGLLVFELEIGGLRDLVILTRISARPDPLNTPLQCPDSGRSCRPSVELVQNLVQKVGMVGV